MPEVVIRGIKIAYQDLNPGGKATIVFVHGHPFDHTMWSYQLHALREFRLILPDLKGYGQSEIGLGDIYIEEQALDLVLLLDSLQIEKAHLIGLSMGGQIIVEFARLFPQRILSLILCDGNPGAENEVTFRQRLQLADSIQQIGMVQHTDETIARYLHSDTIISKKEVYQHLYRMMRGTTPEGACASHRGRARRCNNLPYLKAIQVPVMVVVGADDTYTSKGEMRDIAQQFREATFVVIDQAGHLPNMEQPAIFNQRVVSFYEKIK